MSSLTAEELARQPGTTPEQVERFVELGILERGEGTAPFSARDIHRVRLAEAIDAAGISLDDLVFRDGDYFGQTVNLASRIADYARPREVLVSADVAELAARAAVFEPIGEIGLRGVAEPVALFRALNRDSSPPE